MENGVIEHFPYNEKDFRLRIQGGNEESTFDKRLKDKWNQIEENDVLRYSVKSLQCKILEGKYRFCSMLNIERAINRRRPEDIMSMLQPFDPNRFNFTKISHKEILFDIGNGDGNDIIAVNVSPILWSHCLLVTQRFSNLPQQVTHYSFQKAIEILLLSNSVNMRLLCNSLCGNASVNHLHWHLYYLNYRMYLEQAPLSSFMDAIYTIEDYPAKGFCIKLSSFDNLEKYVSYAFKIVCCLQEAQIAHNIYITRSKTDVHQKEFDDIRAYIWARSSSFGIKFAEDFNIAACELFGHMPIITKEAYEYVDEDYVSKRLEQVTADAYLAAKELIPKALRNNEDQKESTSSSV